MTQIEQLSRFFDTHGSITLTVQRSGSEKLRIAIVKANVHDLEGFRAFFGVGRVGGYPQEPPYRYYMYYAYSKNARQVLAQMLPYLEAKKARAREVLESKQDHTLLG